MGVRQKLKDILIDRDLQDVIAQHIPGPGPLEERLAIIKKSDAYQKATYISKIRAQWLVRVAVLYFIAAWVLYVLDKDGVTIPALLSIGGAPVAEWISDLVYTGLFIGVAIALIIGAWRLGTRQGRRQWAARQ